jgi:hypothetical protein
MEAESVLVPAAITSIVAAPILALVAWARRPTGLGLALLLIALTTVAVWGSYVAFVAADYRDADGFVDCWPGCTAWQTSVRWVLVGGPILAAVLAGLALITAWRARAS